MKGPTPREYKEWIDKNRKGNKKTFCGQCMKNTESDCEDICLVCDNYKEPIKNISRS